MTVTRTEALTANEFHENITGKRWRRNGKTQVWKTRTQDFKVPVKFGLYAYGYITQDNCGSFHVANTWKSKGCPKCT